MRFSFITKWPLALAALTALSGHSAAVLAADANATPSALEDSSMVLADGVDDSACVFKLSAFSCVPAAYCSYQYKFGDLTLDQSCRLVADKVGRLPQQLHLAFAGTPTGTGMTISWTTYTQVDDPHVWVGASADALALDTTSTVEVRTYYQEGKYSLYSYHATVTGLKPFSKYFYKVGSLSQSEFQSQPNAFTTARPANSNETFEIAVYGDLGADPNANDTITYVRANLVNEVDFVYHVGDVSYADNAFLSASEFFGFFYEETYNRWMNSLTPVMKQLPYMVLVGNHEAECHSPACIISSTKRASLGFYNAYNARFKMPSAESGGVKNMWYSFEYGPIHFTSISSETDYTDAPSNSFIGQKYGGYGDQLTWLEADLKAANANRANVPWLIVGMHRAMYTLDKCDANGVPTDEALPVQQAFEELFIKYNVDIVVAGHVHSYERHLPIARTKPVFDGVSADKKTYTNPKAPVYITSGAAGNSEGHENFKVSNIPWNVVTDTADYGISKLKVVNRTALTWNFIVSKTGAVVDEFTIVKQ
ncbi:Acid phosphatase, partial [Globisporangium splendens]